MKSKVIECHGRPKGADTILSADVRASSVISALAVSSDGTLLGANDCLLALIGLPIRDVLGRDIRESLLAESSDWRPWEAARQGKRVTNVSIRLRTADGRTVPMRGDILPMTQSADTRGWLSGLFIDDTPARQLDSALNHAARVEAVASLTSGIAHDFSNLLTVLMGNLYLISEAVRDRGALYEKIKLTRGAAKRGVDLIRQLLAFARNEEAESGSLDLVAVTERLRPLLQRALGTRISLETRVAPGVWCVNANAGLLESVLVNLVVNARDAMEGDGTIQIVVINAQINEREAAAWGLGPGDYVRLSVIDNGVGIPESLIGRVFEPFFSTKGSGKGTGLGLAMVRRFAADAGGTVHLRSQVGHGTTVSLLLPATTATAATTMSSTMPLSTLPTGKETVLMIGDDDAVCGTVEQILAVLGYRVFVEKRLSEAFNAVQTAAAQLVVIDVKGGAHAPARNVLAAVSGRQPEVGVLVICDSESARISGVTTLIKPFDLAGLATAVRRTLDGAVG
jgi:signal transduction histidine kinase